MTWDFSFGTYTVWVSKTQTWKFFGHDFQDVGSSVFGDLEFALQVSKTQKDLGNFRIWFSGHGFQDLGSQLRGLDFHTCGFQDWNLKTFRTWFSRCGISILGPGFHTGGFTWSKTWNFFSTWFSGHGWGSGRLHSVRRSRAPASKLWMIKLGFYVMFKWNVV
jgi:hypothetical protein